MALPGATKWSTTRKKRDHLKLFLLPEKGIVSWIHTLLTVIWNWPSILETSSSYTRKERMAGTKEPLTCQARQDCSLGALWRSYDNLHDPKGLTDFKSKSNVIPLIPHLSAAGFYALWLAWLLPLNHIGFDFTTAVKATSDDKSNMLSVSEHRQEQSQSQLGYGVKVSLCNLLPFHVFHLTYYLS